MRGGLRKFFAPHRKVPRILHCMTGLHHRGHDPDMWHDRQIVRNKINDSPSLAVTAGANSPPAPE